MVLTRIYAVHYNRSDFIELQKQCLDRWFRTPFEYIVINNGRDPDTRSQLAYAAAKIGSDIIYTHSDTGFDKAGKHHADALNQAWKEHITKHNDLAMVLDGDVFLLDNFTITDILSQTKPIFGVPQHRKVFNYISPTLVGMDLAKITLLEEIDWEGKEIVPKVHLDTGGGLHPWCHAGVVRPISNTWHIKADNNNLHTLPDAVMTTYREGFDVELYGDKWLHYCRSSGWDWPTEDYVHLKSVWLRNFLDMRLACDIQLKYTGFNIGVNDYLGWV